MTSLVDIGPLTERVTVRGRSFDVRGLSGEEFFKLVLRFPAFRVFIDKDPETLSKLDPGQIATELPVVGGAIIAACVTDKFGDEKEETAARKLPMSAQLKFLDAAIRVTFEDGIGPFVVMMNGLMTLLQPPSSRPPVSAASGTPSIEPSPASLDVDTVRRKSGPTRRDKSSHSTARTTGTAAPN